MAFSIIYGVLGIYTIIMGFKIIATGKTSASEEKKLAAFTEKAAKTYKLTEAIINILFGLLMIGLSVIEILIDQKVMEGNKTTFTIIFLSIAAVLGIVLLIVWFKCKKDSQNGKE